MNTQQLYRRLLDLPDSSPMPVLFIGHGNPMNAIEDNVFSKTWAEIGQSLPQPKAILSVSAHWITPGEIKVTSMEKPRTIHDFYGFPNELFEQQYPAPGAPDLARETIEIIKKAHVDTDLKWGLDHGTWSVLLKMFPEANIPVYQLSLDYSMPPAWHYEIAGELQKLRKKGVLIIGSGNLVHNLHTIQFNHQAYDWAVEFDQKIAQFIDDRNYRDAVDFLKLGQLARLAQPTHDHYLPLIYSLGQADVQSEITYFNEGFDLASISMRSFVII